MSIRWRANGLLLCAAKFKEEKGDFYIDDDQHYKLSVIAGAIMADADHLGPKGNGLWYWVPDRLCLAQGLF